MPFPEKLLAPGEQVVLESHAHWSLLVPRAFVLLLVLAGCVAVVVFWGTAPLWVGYVLLAIGLIALTWFVGKLATWWSALLVITTSRVIYRHGVVRRMGREIPLGRVQDVSYRQNLLERLLGAGSLLVESAGDRGQDPFPDIRRPARVQSVINQLLSGVLPTPPRQAPPPPQPEFQRQQPRREISASVSWAPRERSVEGGTPDGEAATGELSAPSSQETDPNSLSDQLERLAHLHRAGVITDAEFDAKKEELLRRL